MTMLPIHPASHTILHNGAGSFSPGMRRTCIDQLGSADRKNLFGAPSLVTLIIPMLQMRSLLEGPLFMQTHPRQLSDEFLLYNRWRLLGYRYYPGASTPYIGYSDMILGP